MVRVSPLFEEVVKEKSVSSGLNGVAVTHIIALNIKKNNFAIPKSVAPVKKKVKKFGGGLFDGPLFDDDFY